jgi:uncharacterized protein YndB with AHSA1/START domain
MPERKTHHATIVIERTFDAPVTRVFEAWADIGAKARWFCGTPGQWKETDRRMDFRAGGKEHLSGKWTNGTVTAFDCIYHEIVPDARIVYSYDMRINGKHISVSLATVEFRSVGRSTGLVFTEQLVNLDDFEDHGGRGRKEGTNKQFDQLERALEDD